jgi:hypothetical protein
VNAAVVLVAGCESAHQLPSSMSLKVEMALWSPDAIQEV